jgi:hypothetical protein
VFSPLFFIIKMIVNVNEKLTHCFQITRGVRQGCSLAPYLFIIVGEALNNRIKEAMVEGLFKVMKLPHNAKH